MACFFELSRWRTCYGAKGHWKRDGVMGWDGTDPMQCVEVAWKVPLPLERVIWDCFLDAVFSVAQALLIRDCLRLLKPLNPPLLGLSSP